MDVIFNCPKCGQELEVDSSGAGEEITCPACNQKILIPITAGGAQPAPAEGAGEAAPASGWGGPAKNTIAQSAAAKIEKHLKVPTHDKPQEGLIAKAAVPLEVAAKESDRQLRVKSIRHIDCVEVGHDKFDEIVGKFLAKVGEHNLISVTPLAYSHLDIASQKQLTDYGVFIVYKG
jgi:DNA-directed RNA polymerase subunit RPC12/RpoP